MDEQTVSPRASAGESQGWRERLADKAEALQSTPLAMWLDEDSPACRARAEALSWQWGPLTLDASKQRLDQETLQLLLDWAESRELHRWREALFAGEIVNPSEGRPAWHAASRWGRECPPPSGSEAAVAEAQAQHRRMAEIVACIRNGRWQGATGLPIRHLVHIGVGGSDLGPRLVSEALAEAGAAGAIGVHFVSSMDGGQLLPLMERLDPAATLLVVASKSFTTADTSFNLRTALTWLEEALATDEAEIRRHQLVGVSAHPERMAAFGIPEAHQLTFSEGVGGRFSLWSAIGVSLAVRIGMPAFEGLLEGAHAMDRHFLEAPSRENLPVLSAVIGAWNSQFLGIPSHAILPYDSRLASLPAYLQQLEMESNGKSCMRDGRPVESATCPILWGEVGPNAQHAFYQLLHQGSHTVSAELLAVAHRHGAWGGRLVARLRDQQRLTLANCLAQSQLLALGDEAIPASLQGFLAQGYRGNQPHSVWLLEALTPQALGSLLALYEHKVFVQSLLWGLNPFDQPGVELGKRLASSLYRRLGEEAVAPEETVRDIATERLVSRLTGVMAP
ncbi:glucose-6-phosphate isomerase [Halomonas stenophila]|uniref:Glucose-6-phosphate isomerase n=1 Tax=Halomonas stenophila TaxID=795312 RepID=A0A7W5HJU3_9GAMM|nr:glucose-6-phosphate isomerase [Halomonas stenophila]MBB3229767.1 glucose-6-phosphate isomerase [Halomonas stenophila]